MDEEKEIKKEVSEPQEEKSEEEETPQEYKSPIEQAREVADRMEKTTEDLRKENDRREKIMAEDMLAGKAEGGQGNQREEETPQEYKDRLLRGELKESEK